MDHLTDRLDGYQTAENFNRYRIRRQKLDGHDTDYLANTPERVTTEDLEKADITS